MFLLCTEHKKMSSALDKCPHCFSNIPKHLIVAIGIKVRIDLLCRIMASFSRFFHVFTVRLFCWIDIHAEIHRAFNMI